MKQVYVFMSMLYQLWNAFHFSKSVSGFVDMLCRRYERFYQGTMEKFNEADDMWAMFSWFESLCVPSEYSW